MIQAALVLHLFGVVFWLGTLLVLTSMLALVPDAGIGKERLIFTAKRLLALGGNIGASVAIAFGIILIALEPEVLRHGWLHVKLVMVLILLVLQWRLSRRITALANDPASASSGEFRMLHGIYSLLLLVILVLAIWKPF